MFIILQCGSGGRQNTMPIRVEMQTTVFYFCLRNWNTKPHFLSMNLRGKLRKVASHQSMQHGSSPVAVKGATKCGSGAGPENCGGPDLGEYCSIHRRSELHDWSRPNEDLRKKKKSFVIWWSIAHHGYKFPSKDRSWHYSFFLLTNLLSKLKNLSNRWQM